jgi:hypothetical protein
MTVPPEYNPVQPGEGGAQPPGYPQYQPQPGYPPAYQPPAPLKKSNTTRTVLIIVGVVALVCCAGLAIGGFFLFNTAKNAIGPARDQANAFVQDLEADNARAAYDKLCTSTRARYSQQDLIRAMASEPRIVSHKVTGFNISTNNGETTADITMELTDDSGASGKHTFHLVKEDGDWFVCGDPF